MSTTAGGRQAMRAACGRGRRERCGRTCGQPISVTQRVDGDFLEGLLLGATDPWTPGVSSRFVCGDHDLRGGLTWSIRAYDVTGALVDCVIWGHDPHGVKLGAHPGDTPVTNQPEVAGCRVP